MAIEREQSEHEQREALNMELARIWEPGLPHDSEGDVTEIPLSFHYDEKTKARTGYRAWRINVYGYRAVHADVTGEAVAELELRSGRLVTADGSDADIDLLEDLVRVIRQLKRGFTPTDSWKV